MAVRKTNTRKKAAGKAARHGRVPVSMVFWIFFFVVLTMAFFVLLPQVKKGETIALPKNAADQSEARQPPSAQVSQDEKVPAEKPVPSQPEKPAALPAPDRPAVAQPTAERPPAAKPKDPPPVAAAPPPQKPVEQKAAQPPAAPVVEKPVETHDRGIYFMRENGANLQLAKVNRKLAVSDSPLVDCLNSLFAGPTADEQKRGFMNFIPPGARIIGVRVNGNTAYVNCNEEFRYNTLGREGSDAQLKQIIWTATEFPNVHNVQIQIEGKTVDFLTEGITIRNPVSR